MTPTNQLITWDEYDEIVEEFGEYSDTPIRGADLVHQLKHDLTELSHRVDQKFPDLSGATFDGEKLSIKRAYFNYESPSMKALKSAISQKMPTVSIIDVITDAVRWLNLEDLFKPLSGHSSKINDFQLRLIATLFCYGCNVGPQQTVDSIKTFSRKQIAWLNSRFSTVPVLEKAITRTVNMYSKMSLPKKWGDGRHASADGTHQPLYDANMLSEFHARYRKKGAIGYYVVSDQYIALFSHFISCGVHESWHILDGVAKNEMNISPDILHGDTHAQNYVVFGLSHLMGIQLMPRIRGIKN